MTHNSPRTVRTTSCVNVEEALESVPRRVRDAAVESSRRMAVAGIRHALIGGLAVGAYGLHRTTGDVDFLIGEEGMIHHAGGVVTLRPEIPIAVGPIAIDFVGTEHEEALEQALDQPGSRLPVPVVPVEVLILLKLRSNRMQDRTDIFRLVDEQGVDIDCIRKYLQRVSPALVYTFEKIVDAL